MAVAEIVTATAVARAKVVVVAAAMVVAAATMVAAAAAAAGAVSAVVAAVAAAGVVAAAAAAAGAAVAPGATAAEVVTRRGRRCLTQVSWDPRDILRVLTACIMQQGTPPTYADRKAMSRASTEQIPANVASDAVCSVIS